MQTSVPINLPALAISSGQTIEVNKELIAHGISNILAGAFGTCQNYLCYTNSILIIRSGGDSLAGELTMAVFIALLFFYGNAVLSFVPTVVVGSMIFYLAMCLTIESFYDTWIAGISKVEYGTILFISSMMMVMGFTEVCGGAQFIQIKGNHCRLLIGLRALCFCLFQAIYYSLCRHWK